VPSRKFRNHPDTRTEVTMWARKILSIRRTKHPHAPSITLWNSAADDERFLKSARAPGSPAACPSNPLTSTRRSFWRRRAAMETIGAYDRER
jgi:hypothetical protein